MLKKSLAFVAGPVLLVMLACQKERPATETVSTGTSPDAVTAPAPITNPPEVTHAIDHYKFWKVKQTPFQKTVTLKGQFDPKPWEGSLTAIVSLGNPVEKNGAPILNPNLHLDAYQLAAPPQPPRQVKITNQFVNDQPLTVTNASLLLVPALKSLTGTPTVGIHPAGDHYVCYAIQPVPAMDKQVQLRDQLDKKRDKVEQITKLLPVHFCVPVSKNGGPINKPDEHLTIYRISPSDLYSIQAYTYDQFGSHVLSVERSEWLAVPSFKKWNPSF